LSLIIIRTLRAHAVPVLAGLMLLCSYPCVYAQDRFSKQDSIKKAVATQPDDTAKVNLLNSLSETWLQTNNDSVGHYAHLAFALAERLHYPKGMANAGKYKGIFYRIKGDYTPALNALLHSFKIFESIQDKSSMAGNYLDIAQVYKDMGGAGLTLEYINKGITYSRYGYSLYEAIHDSAGMATSLNMCGILYRDIGKLNGREHYYDTAFAAYTKAISLIEVSGKGKETIGRLYNNISQVYNEYRKDYKKALEYLFKAVEFNKSNNNISSLSFNYGNISSVYIKMHRYDEGLEYARKTLETAQLLNRPERLRNAYFSMYQSFRACKRFDSALRYYKLADLLDDSLNNVAKTRQVLDLQTKYETGKKESEILRLQTESRAKNKQIILLIAALLLFAALAACMLWFYHRIKRQRQQIAQQSQKLEVMMKELHHRVKNNLQIVSSLLSLQTYKVQDEEAVLVLKESQQRVQAMSFIHQRLYKTESLTGVNMTEYITDLVESLVSSYGFDRNGFDLQITVQKEMLDIDKALPIGLIINELVTNALKYAYGKVNRPSLYIGLIEKETTLICRIKDNGIGINEQQWKQQRSSFGKQLISALCKQLRAQQTLVVHEGTQFTITIPIAA
jgi:two-component sensor histidine kinase